MVLASGQDHPTFLAIDGTNAYWANLPLGGNGTIMTAPLSGAGPVRTLASGQRSPEFLVIDGTNVYWTTIQSGSVLRVAK